MKKVVALCLALVMSFVMVACGTSAGNAGEGNAAATPDGENAQAENVTAESGENTEKMEGTIKVLSFTEYHDAVQATLDAFMDANPGVTVELEDYPFAQYADAVEIKLGSSSSDYDVLLTDTTMVSAWAYQGWIAPVDEYFTEEDKAKFAPALVEAGTFEGEFYSPPICNSCQVLWYNKDILEDAGLELPSSDPSERLTWEEVVEMGQKIMKTKGSDGVYALTFEQVDRPYQILPLANSAGGDAFAEDGLSTDGYLNSEAFVKGMQFYSDIHNVYNIAPKGTSASETVGLFTAGQVAFICANIFNYGTFSAVEGLNFGYTAFPYFEDGIEVSPTGSWHVSVSNFSENKDLAIQLAKYFSLGEGNDIFLDTRGAFAANIEGLQAYETDSAYSEFPKDVFRLASYEAKNTAYPRPVTVGYGIFEKIIESTFSDIRNGVDVKEALDSAVEQLDTQLAMYK